MEITLQGLLKSFHLSELLNFLNMGEKTGTLNLNQSSCIATLYFDAGNAIYATSNQKELRLSSLLVRRGKITEQRWKDLEDLMLQEGKKFGEVALEHNALTNEELLNFLKLQVAEIIFDCFTWTAGSFAFQSSVDLPDYAVPISIDPANLILEGARRIDDIEYLTENLPASKSILRTVVDPSRQDFLNLTIDEWKILFLIDGKRTIEEVTGQAAGTTLDVYRLLYGLIANRFVEIVPEEGIANQEDLKKSNVTHKLKVDTRLLISDAAALTYKDVLKITLARLTLKKVGSEKQTFPLLEQEYFIGRQLGNQIHISDPSISNIHARIFKGPEGYVLEDLNSRNGTFVNGERIDRRLLRENDLVRLGNSNFVYNIVYEVKRIPKTRGKDPKAKSSSS